MTVHTMHTRLPRKFAATTAELAMADMKRLAEGVEGA